MNFFKKIFLTVVAIYIVISLSITFIGCPTTKPIEETTEEVITKEEGEDISEILTEEEKVQENNKITEEETPEETTEELTTEEEKSPIPFYKLEETYKEFIDETENAIVYMYEVLDAINSNDLKSLKENNDILINTLENLGKIRKELDFLLIFIDTDNDIEKEKINIIKDSIDTVKEIVNNIVKTLEAKIEHDLTKFEESLKEITNSYENLVNLHKEYVKLGG